MLLKIYRIMATDASEHLHTNKLIHESSPYLLQHAHNPVNWHPWGEEAWQLAREQNKLVIISIGYSACHWCHVMERESFEDEHVAKLMNDNYICIKVDREERPDVDQLYMDAAQIMTGRGGWPLNAYALPDRRPVYAGTYFPKNQWSGLLREISTGYRKQPAKYIEYAEKLVQGIKGLNPSAQQTEISLSQEDYVSLFQAFQQYGDRQYGGIGRAPKFPMPVNYLFLLEYYYHTKKPEALEQCTLTLDKMARGGIYDQLGGGFARYATDAAWLIPHFEKMLYDNAQLIALYSRAWQLTHKPLYKAIVHQTVTWLKREMTSPDGGFYCAQDADSEGEEGKYYVWTKEAFEAALGANQDIVTTFFGIGKEAYWENGNNIPVLASTPEELAKQFDKSLDEIDTILNKGKEELLVKRKERIAPETDTKILLSWNAMMIDGLCTAYMVFQDNDFLQLALTNLTFLQNNFIEGNVLIRSKRANAESIPAFLEDHAQLIKALIALYSISFDKAYLLQAEALTKSCIEKFADPDTGMFYFTSADMHELINRKIDTSDNVIPSPNSVMAHNLLYLGHILGNEAFTAMAYKMLQTVWPQVQQYSPYYANWAMLAGKFTYPLHETAILGEEARNIRLQLEEEYIPNNLIAGSIQPDNTIALLQNRHTKGKTLIHICEEMSCQMPVSTAQEAIALLHADH